jgi:stage II sporulation protein AA (anti-sigma F factor antagonist)
MPHSTSAPLAWSLDMHTDRAGPVLVVAPRGRLGTLTSGAFIEVLVGAIRAGERRVLLDMSGVDYVSSAGLLALEAVQGRLLVARGELVICCLGEPVRLAFELAGLLAQFAVEDSRERALARLVSATP